MQQADTSCTFFLQKSHSWTRQLAGSDLEPCH